jgi:hypothetical protein
MLLNVRFGCGHGLKACSLSHHGDQYAANRCVAAGDLSKEIDDE